VQSGGVSSLIFLVVIGVWAAYFIQYWVRRRDHLATARSVDQFSQSMRVLERRSALSGADATRPQRDSSAVSPAQPARAQLLLGRTASSTAAAEPAHRDAVAPGTARRNRAMVLIGALSTWLVAVPLMVLGLLGVAYLAVPVVSLVVALAWLRHSAVRDRAASRATTPVRPRPTERDTRTTSRETQPAAQPRTEPIAPAVVEAGNHAVVESGIEQPADLAQGPVATHPREELYDLEAVEAVAAAASTPIAAPTTAPAAGAGSAQTAAQWGRYLVDEDDIPLTWDPVPVPRPTYTLKARATRPAPTAADLVGDADTEYASHTDELPVRQVAGA